MNTRSLIATLSVCATAMVVWVTMSTAGPLDPPAGPIAPTPGPEPRFAVNADNTPGDATALFIINQPGSYYLEGNVTGESGKHGVVITAHNVTLDLMGFALIGVTGSLNGVHMPNARESVVIRNGVVSAWGGDGVHTLINNGAIENVHTRRNAGWGIDNDAFSLSSRITACSALFNGAGALGTGGIQAGDASTVESCQARDNTGDGVVVRLASTVSGCTSAFNSGSGIVAGDSTVSGNTVTGNGGAGIVTTFGSTVSDNTASFNTGDGIRVAGGSLVLNNNCTNNGLNADGAGIHATSINNRIEGNNVIVNDRGIDVDSAGNFIVRNTARSNPVNYDIASGNVCFVVLATTSGAISGSSGGVSPGTTDPWANFSY